MRLRRLDLTRYGKFTGRSLDFGPLPQNAPDLHIVYGPNEAGKSTAFAAFLDLLYGMPMRSPYNFLHPYDSMRIGACLEVDGTALEVVRLKRPAQSLLDGAGNPLPDTALSVLAGLTREAYRSMFSLDDESLELGGEAILASKGQLGELLFAASAGLGELSARLVALRGEAEGIYRRGSSRTELGELKQQLARAQEQRREIDTAAAEHARLAKARDLAAGQYDAALAERGEILARQDSVSRRLRALPRLAALDALRTRLAPLASLPEPPPGWADRLPALRDEGVALDTGQARNAATRAALAAELATLQDDPAGLQAQVPLAALADLQARDRTAGLDLPDRLRECDAVDRRIAALLASLGRDGEADPRRLLLGAAELAGLRRLIAARSGIAARVEAAAAERAKAAGLLQDAQRALAESDAAGLDADAAALLNTRLATLRGSDHVARLARLSRDRDDREAVLATRLAKLRPWSGDGAALAALAVPGPGQMEAWRTRLETAAEAARHAAEGLAERRGELSRLRAERDAIGAAGGIDDAGAAEIRRRREALWADHRRRLDPASADAFEAAMRQDDIATAARLNQEKEVLRLRGLDVQLAVAAAEATRWQAEQDAAAAGRAAAEAEIAAAVAGALPPGAGLSGLQAWLAARDKALEAHAALDQADRDLAQAQQDAAARQGALHAALAEAGAAAAADSDWIALLARAQALLDRQARLSSRHEALRAAARDADRRGIELEQAGLADRAWLTEWQSACAACWLGEAGTPEPETVTAWLDALAALAQALGERQSLADRIRDMQAEVAAFAEGVGAIAAELGLDAGRPAAVLATEIAARAEAAARTRTRATEAAAALAEADDEASRLADARARHAAELSEMTAFFAVPGPSELAVALAQAGNRAEWRAQAEAAEAELRDTLGVASLQAAEALLQDADAGALRQELDGLQARFDLQDARTRELFAASRAASDRLALIGGDDAAARLDTARRTLLLEIEDRARRYLRLHAGTAAAERAMKTYRDEHQGAMLSRASDAFRMISRGAYRGLATQPDGQVLVAVDAGGASKLAKDLSKGTRFQLYLALRAAGYHEFAALRTPVPFVADDIMETFDDFRAEEAFRLLADMATRGQVIYLTHHRHLCEIARRHIPGARLHDLLEDGRLAEAAG